ncbi:MAG TPA: SIMPL domain-containing protein [Alphaproteobacteria bacterium]|nr:SIMPL domain-containing protein [Alphaproteobacteria bacterium]
MPALNVSSLRALLSAGPAVLPVLGALLSAVTAIGQAQAQAADMPRDEIVLQLAAEDWVETKTARVVASADVAIAGENRASVRDRMLDALKKLSPEADWRLSQFTRSQDSAGLERWRVTAETRLAEKSLGGLDDRAKSLSQPGLQLRIAATQFTPTLEEREATLAKLRAKLYAQAKQEAEQAGKTWPDRAYRVARVDFQQTVVPMMRMQAEAAPMAAAGGASFDAGGDVAVAQKLTLQATVTLSPSK